MCNKKYLSSKLKQSHQENVEIGNGKTMKVKETETIVVPIFLFGKKQCIDFRNVLYLAGLNFNLLLVSTKKKMNYTVLFSN